MNFFINGLQHPFLIPAHLILMVSLALLLAQQGNKHLYWGIPSFILGITSGLIGSRLGLLVPDIIWLLIPALVIALLTALYLSWGLSLTCTLAIGVGFLVGIDSAPLILPGFSQQKINLTLMGTGVSAALYLTTCTLVGVLLQRLWQGVIVRSLASWVAAAALMTLALQFVSIPQ